MNFSMLRDESIDEPTSDQRKNNDPHPDPAPAKALHQI
jgi:hypothetical protein